MSSSRFFLTTSFSSFFFFFFASFLAILKYTRLGLHPTSVKILWEVFLAISAAEIGDKSMVATLTLSTSQDALGVFLGGCVGHAGVTLLAVVAGLLFQGRFDENKMNLACAILFFIFGLGTLYEALAR
ncbi:transmembrane protein [Cystoisospora suis]|uniref:GDT1 family protein n=1 Tax=Cystoisospora suis TaxID=483139 RepID=A0A2C6KRN4_9APIC|nr:transmembrane protein [Cystoisospora suis]